LVYKVAIAYAVVALKLSLRKRQDKAREYLDGVRLHDLLEKSGFRDVEINVVSREKQIPHFQTVFATGVK
jgi:hypothetical protein